MKAKLPSPQYISNLQHTVDFLMELNKILQEVLTHLDSHNIININTDSTTISSHDKKMIINESRLSVKSQSDEQIADISPEGCLLSNVQADGLWDFKNMQANGLSNTHDHGIPSGSRIKVILPGQSSETYITFNS